MQIVPTVSNDPTFTAVFALSTPAYDHSGLSHLVEHMVFRGSDDYPANHELFLINSLLPATINATTENGYTFFYVESKVESIFLKLIDYLAAGIFQKDYPENEFTLEKNGVVFQELLMYEATPEYSNYAKSIRGSQSKHNVFNYGGFSDLLVENTIDRLIDYKKAHYHQNETTLYIKASCSLIDQVTSNLRRWESTHISKDTYQHPPISIPKKKPASTSIAVLSFFIHIEFYQSIKSNQTLLSGSLSEHETLVIEENVNPCGLFAMRLISNNIELTKCKFLKTLNELAIIQRPFKHESKKQKGFVKEVVSQHLNKFIIVPPCKPLPFYLERSELSATNEIVDGGKINTEWSAVINSSRIAAALNKYLSLENIPTLPRLFEGFFKKGECNEPIQRDNNWLLPINHSLFEHLVPKITQAQFWLPRLNGDCYAMGLGWKNNRLYVYGAQDKNPNQTLSFMENHLK